jgi:hypothetical protein
VPDTLPHRVELDAASAQLFLVDGDGRRIRLHSLRDPLAEADQLIDAALEGRPMPKVVCLLGMGLGYAIDRIAIRSPETSIVVFEPFAEAARAALSQWEWTTLLASGRLHVLVGPDYDAPTPAIRLLADANAIATIVHPVLLRETTEELRRARRAFDRLQFEAAANAEAERKFAAPYLCNTLANLRRIAASRDVRELFDSARGRPAVVIGAGPSLDRNVAWLRAVRDRACVVAVDTALTPLVRAGIEPDLVVAVDPSAVNARHFAHVPPLSRAALVAEGSLHPACFAPFDGRVFTFRVGNSHPWPLLRARGIERSQLTVWGSVLTAACDLALRMGCDPVVFAASDLSFTDGQPYCRGTAYEADWAREVLAGMALADVWARYAPDDALVLDDLRGVPVKTTGVLQAFRDWIVDTARKRADVRFINATGAGILAGGRIHQMTGAEVDVALEVRTLDRSPDGHVSAWDAGRAQHDAVRLAEPLRGVLAALGSDDAGGDATQTARAWQQVIERGGDAQDLRDRLQQALAELTAPAAPAAALELPSVAPGLTEVAQALLDVLRHERLVAARGERLSPHAAIVAPPWSSFIWAEPALPAIDRLRFLLDELLVTPPWIVAPESSSVPTVVRPAVWPTADDQESAASSGRGDCQALEDEARLALWREWLLVARKVWPGDAVAAAGIDQASVLRGFVEQERHDRVAGIEQDGSTRLLHVTVGPGLTLPIGPFVGRPTRVSREKAGLLLRVEPGAIEGSPVDRFFRAPVHVAPPRSLSLEGLGLAIFGSSHGSHAAVFATPNSSQPVLIREDGTWQLLPAWPGLIRGIRVLDAENGAAVAWNPEECRVMYRPHSDADIITQDVSFPVSSCYVDGQGGLWWTSWLDGLYRGVPGEIQGPVAATPRLIGIHEDGDGLRLDPAALTDTGEAARRRVSRGWRYRPSDGSISECDLDPLGPCTFSSIGTDWIAAPYIHAETIRLTHRRRAGLVVDLLCYFPLATAWAGRSLIVTTGGAEVLCFQRLADVLDRLYGTTDHDHD